MGGILSEPGERAVKFIGNLTLTEDAKGRPFLLRTWQAEIPRKLFGTLRPDGLRRFRKCFMFLPRKQAKTQLFAGIATYCLLGDGKQGQEIDLAAGDRKQASHLFKKADEMIQADPFLRKKVRVYKSEKRMEAKRSGNLLQVLSSDGGRQHGLNPSVVLIDELHVQKNRDLYDALTSAQATRTEPLVAMISTAGNDRLSICHDEYEYACKVRDGKIDDPEYLAVIYEAPKDADWLDEATWHLAMPALGDFCSLDFIRSEFRKARESPSEESKCRQLYLNQWVASAAKWLNRAKWDACNELPLDLDELEGRECYAGLDLSNTSDITAFVLIFPMDDGSYRVVCRFWIPEEYADVRDRKGHTKYRRWSEQGLITLTPGDVIDYDWIKAEILGTPATDDSEAVPGLIDRYQIRKVLIDKFNGTQIALQLMAAGLDCEFMRQGTFSMNEPVKFLEVMIARGMIRAGDHAVLNWMADNAVAEMSPEGDVKLSKAKSADKIDGMISLVMGLAGAMNDPGYTEPTFTAFPD